MIKRLFYSLFGSLLLGLFGFVVQVHAADVSIQLEIGAYGDYGAINCNNTGSGANQCLNSGNAAAGTWGGSQGAMGQEFKAPHTALITGAEVIAGRTVSIASITNTWEICTGGKSGCTVVYQHTGESLNTKLPLIGATVLPSSGYTQIFDTPYSVIAGNTYYIYWEPSVAATNDIRVLQSASSVYADGQLYNGNTTTALRDMWLRLFSSGQIVGPAIDTPFEGQTVTTTTTQILDGTCVDSTSLPSNWSLPDTKVVIVALTGTAGHAVVSNSAVCDSTGHWTMTVSKLWNDTYTAVATQVVIDDLGQTQQAQSDIRSFTINVTSNPNPVLGNSAPTGNQATGGAVYTVIKGIADDTIGKFNGYLTAYASNFAIGNAVNIGTEMGTTVADLQGYALGVDNLFGGIHISLVFFMFIAGLVLMAVFFPIRLLWRILGR